MSECFNLLYCSNLLAVHLPAGRWLVQAKLTVISDFWPLGNECGLVQSDTTVIDKAPYIGLGLEDYQTSELVALSAVVTTAPDADPTTVAVRCEESAGQVVYWEWGKLTAIEVKDEAQTE